MSDILAKLADLTPERRALLEKRMAARHGAGAPIPRRAGGGAAPLSFAQRRLWFVQRLGPENTAYNLTISLRLRGPLDAEAMRSAFAALAERHEALRFGYAEGPDGEPLQSPGAPPALALTDVSGAEDAEAEARARAEAIAGAPHDLTRPPVRAGLIRVGAEDHVLAIGVHHIAADRWSLGVLVRELAALYEAASRNEPSPLPPVALHAPDFARWRREARGEGIEAQLDWWRGRLSGAPLLELPRRRRPGPAAASGVLPFVLPPGLARAAREGARRRGISLFTLLLAAFEALLSRWCDADDVVLASDVSNRDRPETLGLVGPLVNTLVLRTDLSGDPGFDEIVARADEAFREALAHQDPPLEQVVEALNPERRRDEAVPLFRAKFDLQQAERLPAKLGGVGLERFPLAEGATKYELRFNIEDDGAGLRGRVEYRADLYEAATIERMATSFQRLLAALLERPAAPLSEAAILSEAERAELLALAEGPDLPPHAETLHGAFEAQADRTPEAPAILHGGATLGYAALEARANAVAAALLARGLPAETRIGISMARGADLVAAILGVLKAGCAYVPLDPAYPAARIAFLAEDAEVSIILTDGEAPAFASGAAAELIDVRGLPAASRPAPRATGASLAVVIYTSGSTGRPKGVALEHRNILARVAWAGATFAPEDFAGMLFATSVSFDLSLFEIFATLAHGGRLVLVGTLLDLPRLPPEAGVTFLNTVPSLLRELVKRHEIPASVRTICLAGEFFPPALLDRLREFPWLRSIHNLYGPTEDAIYDAGNRVENEPERPMPIGRPFPGSRLHILDRMGALLPRGVAGEICVGGAGLARGYLNRPELDAEKFLPDPFRREPGARLYRTGDRGRWRDDGRIDILGRIDAQVKIRGQRIETGEIEAALESHPAIAEAVVLATGDPGDPDRQLVAHAAPRAGESPGSGALRDFLAARLPAHMIPGLWRFPLDLPRMPNGKVDRRALAAASAPEAPAHAPPETMTERRVVALWADLLGREGIGAEDDFFAEGGHSLMAMRLLIRLREEFGVELALGRLFHALTPRLQAALVDEALASAAAPPAEEADPTEGLSDAEVEALLARMADEIAEGRS